MIVTDPMENIPEISLRVYKYEILGLALHVMLSTDQVKYFENFINKLNSIEDWENSKYALSIDFLKLRHALGSSGLGFDEWFSNTPKWSHQTMFYSALGSVLCEALNKLEPYYMKIYTSHQRDKLIDDITKD